MLGPPAVGKSTVAEQLSDYFKIHHIHIRQVIDEEVDRMVSTIVLHDNVGTSSIGDVL